MGILANNGERLQSERGIPFPLMRALALALYKVVFLLFVCVAGFVALGGVSVDEAAGGSYGTENLRGAFRQRINTTPYGYAKSLLSVLYAFRGWYETVSSRDGSPADLNVGKMPTMSGSCPVVTFPGAAKTLQVLSEVKMPKGDPSKTFKRGVLVAFGLVSVLYLLANVAYVGPDAEHLPGLPADIRSLPH